MVKKGNGKYRMCIDFRKVNAISEPDAYPLPYKDAILRKLAKAKHISTLDLSNAYHQINLDKNSRPITAFTVPGLGLYQYKSMPLGLSYAGATFQRLIDMIVTPELEPYAFAYLDDIIIATESFDEHIRVLKEILTRPNKANLTVNRDKSTFGRSEVRYLGVLVNLDGIKPDPSRVEPILNFPVSRTLKQLRRFLGMSSWYRKFLKDYATLAEPLTKLTSSKVKYIWTAEQQDAFTKIKTLMAEAPLLNCPNFSEKFTVQRHRPWHGTSTNNKWRRKSTRICEQSALTSREELHSNRARVPRRDLGCKKIPAIYRRLRIYGSHRPCEPSMAL
ncbi:hypothetical protein TKK_0016126 [Trichogramma kaykai]|uniref:RNA-directed DNA polymerase n=1 Tax=Trichogramma kaykai TaxID=54128 RepID=A0ABD2W9I3_9HYME